MILDVFTYNQHFVAMMNIINIAKRFPPENGHIHHIIPKCWFKKKGLKVDDSKENTVKLSVEQHILVHKLAALCACDLIKNSMKHAACRLTNSPTCLKGRIPWNKGVKYAEIGRNDLLGKPGYWLGKTHSEETKEKMREAHAGLHWKLTKPRKKSDKPRKTGWKLSEETKEKIRNARRKRKR